MMKRMNHWAILAFVLAGLSLFQTVEASTQEEIQLKDTQASIDQHSNAWSSEEHIRSFAKYFKVPVEVVHDLSMKAQGWGAVTIELALADELNKTQSKDFPLMTDSVNRVDELRRQGQDWGRIAYTLRIRLAPVLAEAQAKARVLRNSDLSLAQKSQDDEGNEVGRRMIREDRRTMHHDRSAHR